MKCWVEGCDNDGNIADHHPDCDPATRCCDDACPIAIQCEWCYTNPESDMNLRKAELSKEKLPECKNNPVRWQRDE